MHLLMVLFVTNLVSNISTKASKKAPYEMSKSIFSAYYKVQVQCKFYLDIHYYSFKFEKFKTLFSALRILPKGFT